MDGVIEIVSPDHPGRALITGRANDFGGFDQFNAFKISPLLGITRTAPYFHDNSVRTLKDVRTLPEFFWSSAIRMVSARAKPRSSERAGHARLLAFMKMMD